MRAPIEIKNCHNSDFKILCDKVNHVNITECNDMNIHIKYCMSMIQLNKCQNVNIIVTLLCQTFRFDACNNCSIKFPDPGNKIQFYSFESPKCSIKVHNILYWDDNTTNDDDIDGPTIDTTNDDDNTDTKDDIIIESTNNNNDKPTYIDYNIPFVKNKLERLSIRWRNIYNKPVFSCKKWKPSIGNTLNNANMNVNI